MELNKLEKDMLEKLLLYKIDYIQYWENPRNDSGDREWFGGSKTPQQVIKEICDYTILSAQCNSTYCLCLDEKSFELLQDIRMELTICGEKLEVWMSAAIIQFSSISRIVCFADLDKLLLPKGVSSAALFLPDDFTTRIYQKDMLHEIKVVYPIS